jgi:hypothetical protein
MSAAAHRAEAGDRERDRLAVAGGNHQQVIRDRARFQIFGIIAFGIPFGRFGGLGRLIGGIFDIACVQGSLVFFFGHAHELHLHEFIALVQADGVHARLARTAEQLEVHLVDDTLLGHEHETEETTELANRHNRLHGFAVRKPDKVDNRAALAVARAFGQAVDLGPVSATLVGEHEQVTMRARREDLLHVVLVLEAGTNNCPCHRGSAP